MSHYKDHDDIVRQAFTQQAETYATNPAISNRQPIADLINAVKPKPKDHVLEVATGPGYIALAFAEAVAEVIGVDLTDAPLAIAKKLCQQAGVTNARFEKADGKKLPFSSASFEIVVCRLAFHHFETPFQVLQEMVRVCKAGGIIAVEDMIASEQSQRRKYYNHVEQLRDSSHYEALPLSSLLTKFAENGLEVEQVNTYYVPQIVENWLRNGFTPPDKANLVRSLLISDEKEDLSGIRPYRNENGELCFNHRMVRVIGRKLRS